MPYREEPTLQELIAGSIEKKKHAKVRVVKTSKKEQTKSFEIENTVEIGEEFIDRSQFKNSQKKAYDANESLDPEFLKSLRENFGYGTEGYKKKPKKQEFELNIVDNEYEDIDEDVPPRVTATVRKISTATENGGRFKENVRTKGNFQMKKYEEYDEDEELCEDYDEYDDYDDYDEAPVRRKKKNILSRILGVLLLLIVIAVVIVWLAISKYAGLFNYVPDEDRLDIPDVVSDENVFNLLLIGTDARTDGGNGLSDTMILVSINKETNQIVLSSFMRDMYVQIPGQETETWHKLNWAHSRGGAELLMDTIEFNFGLEIDYYAKVNFLSFAKIIDSVGGLDIEITDAEAQAMIDPMAEQNDILGNPRGTDYLYEGGSYHMNGNQALAYSRIRKGVGDDFARTDRQREVISLIFDKVKKMGVKEIDDFMEVVIPEISTNMEKQTVKKLMISMLFYLKYEIVSQRVPYGDNGESWSYGSSADGSIIVADFDLNKKRLLETIYGK